MLRSRETTVDDAMNQPQSEAYGLSRFVDAQSEGVYERALTELRAGRKHSHWMWFIFPQLAGLGTSTMAQHYAIRSDAEARAYLEHPVLGPRLVACAEALLGLQGNPTASEIMGYPDDLKLKSSATLFAKVAPSGSAFERLLQRYFAGQRDDLTLLLLGHR